MSWIMLPTVAAIHSVPAVDVVVAVPVVEIVVDVNIRVPAPTATPAITSTATPKCTHHHTHAKADGGRCGYGSGCRVIGRIIQRGVGVHGSRAVYHDRIVARHINHLWIRRLNFNDCFTFHRL